MRVRVRDPRVYLRAGFFQLRGFAYGRVFIKPAPTSAGAIPSDRLEILNLQLGLSHVSCHPAAFMPAARIIGPVLYF